MCLCFDAMFGYVNLMLIKLLMMNLYAKVMYICIRWWIIVVGYYEIFIMRKMCYFKIMWFKDVLYKDVLIESCW